MEMSERYMPANWEMVTIEELFAPMEDGRSLHQGWSPQCEKNPSVSPDEWGVLKTTAIQPAAFLPEHNKKLPTNLVARPQIEVKAGDLLITCAGPRSRCGIACLVRHTRPKLMMSGKMYRFRVREHQIDARFLEAFLQTSEAQEAVDQMKTGGSDSGLNLTHDRFRRLRVPVAPLNEQHRIVAKMEELFSELDEGIESLRTAREQLKAYRQALLKHAFEGKLTAEWRAESPDKLESAEALLERIRTEREERYEEQLADWQGAVRQWEANGSEGRRPSKPGKLKELPPLSGDELAQLPELPEGWGWIKIGELCDVVRGGSPRPAGDPRYYGGAIPFLKVADITNKPGTYLNSYSYTITEAGLTKTRQIRPKTLLLSNSGATLGVPKICMIEATMNDGIAAFIGLDESALLYHYYFWQGKTQELRSINQGAAQPNLNTDLIKDTVCSRIGGPTSCPPSTGSASPNRYSRRQGLDPA